MIAVSFCTNHICRSKVEPPTWLPLCTPLALGHGWTQDAIDKVSEYITTKFPAANTLNPGKAEACYNHLQRDCMDWLYNFMRNGGRVGKDMIEEIEGRGLDAQGTYESIRDFFGEASPENAREYEQRFNEQTWREFQLIIKETDEKKTLEDYLRHRMTGGVLARDKGSTLFLRRTGQCKQQQGQGQH